MYIGINFNSENIYTTIIDKNNEEKLILDSFLDKHPTYCTSSKSIISNNKTYVGEICNFINQYESETNIFKVQLDNIDKKDILFIDDQKKEWSTKELLIIILKKIYLDISVYLDLKNVIVGFSSSFNLSKQGLEVFENAFASANLSQSQYIHPTVAACYGYDIAFDSKKHVLLFLWNQNNLNIYSLDIDEKNIKTNNKIEINSIGEKHFIDLIFNKIKEVFEASHNTKYKEGSENDNNILLSIKLILKEIFELKKPYCQTHCLINNLLVEISMSEKTISDLLEKSNKLQLVEIENIVKTRKADDILIVGESIFFQYLSKTISQTVNDSSTQIHCNKTEQVLAIGAARYIQSNKCIKKNKVTTYHIPKVNNLEINFGTQHIN